MMEQEKSYFIKILSGYILLILSNCFHSLLCLVGMESLDTALQGAAELFEKAGSL